MSHQDLLKQIFTCNKSEGNFLPPSPTFPSHKNKNKPTAYTLCTPSFPVLCTEQTLHERPMLLSQNKTERKKKTKKKTSLQLASSSSCFGMCNEISSHLYTNFHKPHVNWL
ncbi:unnamed protein product [Ixodes persulcatus]